MKKIFLLSLISIVVWGSYQTFFVEDNDITASPDFEKPRITYDIEALVKQAIQQYDNVRKQHEQIQINHENVLLSDPDVKNWMIHTYIQSSLLDNNQLEGLALVDQAMDHKHTNDAFIQFAKEVHGVEVTHEEVTNYIQEQLLYIEKEPSKSKFYDKISEALSLSKSDYFYVWEYSRFKQVLLQEKVYLQYQNKYPQLEDESYDKYRERLINLLRDEFNFYRNEVGTKLLLT